MRVIPLRFSSQVPASENWFLSQLVRGIQWFSFYLFISLVAFFFFLLAYFTLESESMYVLVLGSIGLNAAALMLYIRHRRVLWGGLAVRRLRNAFSKASEARRAIVVANLRQEFHVQFERNLQTEVKQKMVLQHLSSLNTTDGIELAERLSIFLHAVELREFADSKDVSILTHAIARSKEKHKNADPRGMYRVAAIMLLSLFAINERILGPIVPLASRMLKPSHTSTRHH